METSDIKKKIEFKKDLITKLEKKIKTSKITSIIVHIIMFFILAFFIKFFFSKISSESFFDFLTIGYVQNIIILFSLIVLIISAKQHSRKDKDYVKKLQKEIKILEEKC